MPAVKPRPTPPIFSAFLLLGLSLTFVNCGDGGKARYDLEPLSDEKAVELLEKAGSDTKKAEAVIDRVNTNRRPDFDFKKFWAKVEAKDVVRRLPPLQQKRLLDLHAQSCKDIDFNEFSKLALRLGRYEYVIGEFRKCQSSSEPVRVRELLLKIMQAEVSRRQKRAGAGELTEAEKEQLVSRFVLKKILSAPNANWGPVICYLTNQDFEYVDRELRERGKTDLANALAQEFQTGCFQHY